ncbi:uncharacterized protein SAPINGB_P005729 [Magnusiomyces paraingens]|uniref:W2 domain-containing protein n=1 Tax=Magnusiomyces paraingens TaxID=2606893 RepID=A0A5E8C3H5_9ASCO|nr:uncharacterized protein SAPINGB_P005729 [Saprochaete ingens]VVT57505.1 unnamed protein product [Saprochaete ingens]
MTLVNICRDNKDPFYRYKMPLIVSKIEGRGNGIRTAIVNTSDVARALSRPPAYITKYFGVELGSAAKINEADDRYIVNGAHEASKLQDLLDGFISKFVLCAACQNPETDLIKLKDGTLTRDCKACGHRSPIDMRHKLTTYIIKNPPSTAKQGKGKKAATASANVGGASTDELVSGEVNGSHANSDEDGSPQPDDEDYDDDELARKINAEASQIGDRPLSSNGNGSNAAGEEWAVDMSEEAIRARQRDISGSMASMTLDEKESNPYDQLGDWITNGTNLSDVEIYKKLVELEIAEDYRACQVIAQTLFSAEKIVEDIGAHAGLLCKLVGSTSKGERYFLGGIERFVGIDHPELVKNITAIFEALYDNDIISEDAFLDWGEHVSKKYVDKETFRKIRKAAKPFLDWLAEAEEEDSSDDDEDEL